MARVSGAAGTIAALLVMFVAASGCGQSVEEEPSKEEDSPMLQAVASVGQNVWVAGQGGIWKSSDLGNSWNKQYESGDKYISDIVFVDDQSGWALEENTLLATTNGGDDWEAVYQWPDDVQDWGFVTREFGYVVSDSQLALSQDGGRTWETVTTPEPVERACFSNPGVGWAIGRPAPAYATAYVTFDGGTTWQESGKVPWIKRGEATLTPQSLGTPSCLSDGSALVMVSYGAGAGSEDWVLYKLTAESGWTEVTGRNDPAVDHTLAKSSVLLPFDTEGLLLTGESFNAVAVEGLQPGSTTWQSGYIDGQSYKLTRSRDHMLCCWPVAGDSNPDGSAWLIIGHPRRTFLLYTEDSGNTWVRPNSPH